MKKHVKLLHARKTCAGFSLTELLIAASLAAIAIGVASSCLVNLFGGNKTASIQVERRAEIDRALDFISDEIRQAKNIRTDVSNALSEVTNALSAASIEFTSPANAQAVLALSISNIDRPIIYYVADNSSHWQGPKVIYRLGPKLNADGRYEAPNDLNQWTVSSQESALIDKIDGNSILASSCSGTSISASGFGVCILNNKIAELYIQTKTGDRTDDVYLATTKSFARVDNLPLSADAPDSLVSAALVGTSSPTNPHLINSPNSDAISNIVLYLQDDSGNIMKVKLNSFDQLGETYNYNPTEFMDENYSAYNLVAYTVKAGSNYSDMGPGEGELTIISDNVEQENLPTGDPNVVYAWQSDGSLQLIN